MWFATPISSARNDRERASSSRDDEVGAVVSKVDSGEVCSRKDFRAKNGALQGDSRDLPCVVMSAESPQGSPFLAGKLTRASFPPPPGFYEYLEDYLC